MEKGKVILSLVALLITIGSNLAFKVAKKFGLKLAFVQVTPTICHQCINVWTHPMGTATKCQTHLGGPYHLGSGVNHLNFFRTADEPQNTCLQKTRGTLVV